MEKMKMHSMSKIDENVKKIAALFPECITEIVNEKGELEKVVDIDAFKQLFSKSAVEGNQERYQFTWPDKRKAKALVNQEVTSTLRPCREESVNFDTTENLYIEGDNLEVLKLLQETYLGKIKMIYIDPPYNTGNDFVYEDDFSKKADEYASNSGQYDNQGNRLIPNPETKGRFHTDWLNMMYPRLLIARDLLKEDGVIFLSIDDNEQANLKKICDEIFGEDNFIASFIWAAGRKNDSKYVSVSHEYILCFVKSKTILDERKTLWREKKQGLDQIYDYYNQLVKENISFAEMTAKMKQWYKGLPPTSPAKNHSHYCNIDKRGIFFASDISWPGGGGPKYEVLHPITHKPVKIPSRGWIFASKEKMDSLIADDRVLFGEDETKVPCLKAYLKDSELAAPYSVFYKDGRASTKRLRTLMGAMVFENPKDEEIIQELLEFTISDGDSIILDFFSGSATTAHAVMKQNAEDGCHRKFIMVQIPEKCGEKTEAFKAGFANICEIGKERIRRAGKQILEEQKNKNGDLFVSDISLDIGFRDLKLDSSNMNDVYYTPEETDQRMLTGLESNIKEDRTAEDLLFQVMLDLGVLLSAKIEEEDIGEKKVFNVDNNYLIACFDEDVDENVIMEAAKKKPTYFVMRDSSLANDSVSVNFDQIFARYSPETIRKVL